MDAICNRLRGLVHDCLDKHLTASAVFYADKLVTFSNGAPADIYLLAQACYASRQYRRAYAVLSGSGMIREGAEELLHLAACCLAESGDWEEVVSLLGDDEAAGQQQQADPMDFPPGSAISLQAALCLLRGRAFEALENRARAAVWYQAALQADPHCWEAFAALTEGHLLTNADEVRLVESLAGSGGRLAEAGDSWLALVMRAKCKKYIQPQQIEACLRQLEEPAAAAAGPHHGQAAAAAGQHPGAAAGQAPGGAGASQHVPGTGSLLEGRSSLAAHGICPTPAPGGAAAGQQQQQHAGGAAAAGASLPFMTPPPPGAAAGGAGRHGRGYASGAPETPGTVAMEDAECSSSDMADSGHEGDEEGEQQRAQGVQPPGGAAAGGGPAQLQEQGAGGGGSGGGGGGGLAGNLDVLACRAELLLHRGEVDAAYALTRGVLCGRDPYALQLLPVHIAAASQLEDKAELFRLAHRLVEEHPGLAVSWYAAGCYYMVARQYETARRYLAKATQLQQGFAPAWLAYGHAFAAQDERDQAMSAYRSAARLFPGLHLPHLGLGAEYCAMANLPLAERALLMAYDLCPDDPGVCHELGVLMYKCGQHAAGAMWLDKALHMLPGARPTAYWEPTLVALGHCLRKLQRYSQAAACYSQALALQPYSASTLAALGYCCQLAGEPRAAVEHYHAALALRPDDAFAGEMLSLALQEFAETSGGAAEAPRA